MKVFILWGYNDGIVGVFDSDPTKKSRGTYDMIRRAEKHGIKTIVVKEEY